MTEMDLSKLSELEGMIKLKMDNPAEYEKYFKTLKEVIIDFARLAKELEAEL